MRQPPLGAEEDITELDLRREGHIVETLRPPAPVQVRKTEMTFTTRPKYVDDGLKVMQYWFGKYYKNFLNGVMIGVGSVGTVWGVGLFSGVLDKHDVIRFVEWRRPRAVALE